MNPGAVASFRQRWFVLGAVCVVLKLWLVSAQPIVAIGPAGHDDRLFLELADHLLHGEWLGPYSQFTLMKGPMFSFFIAGSFLAGIPLPVAQHLLYLAGCVFVLRALRPLLTPAAEFGLFALLWWNPMTYELPVLGRVLRQNLYTPLTLLCFAGLIALTTRRTACTRVRLGWGAVLGFSFAALWLTREETIWIVPSILLLTGAAGWIARKNREQRRSLATSIVAAFATGSAVLSVVCALNLHYYKWYGSVEFRAPQFLAAYGSLQRVNSSYHIKYVPVTREARERIYAVSPAFAELKPYLEGEIGKAWANASSPWIGRPASDFEIGGGWFMWALRDAVMAAGHHPDARSALNFYSRIGAEINHACDEGRLPATRRHDSMVPRWTPGHYTRLMHVLPDYALAFVTFRGFSPYPGNSIGSADSLVLFRDLMRWPLAPSAEAPELSRPEQQRVDNGRLRALEAIGKTSGWIGAGSFFVGFAAWLISSIGAVRRGASDYLHWVATAVLLGIGATFAVNLLVHVMSFPNGGVGALAQGYPLLLLFGGLSSYRLLHRNRSAISRSDEAEAEPGGSQPATVIGAGQLK